MKNYLTPILLSITCSLTAQTTTLYEVNFGDATDTSLTDVAQDTGGSFSNSGFDRVNDGDNGVGSDSNGTDGLGSYVIDLDGSGAGDISSFANLDQTVNLGTGSAGSGVAAGTFLTQTVVFSDISIAETANNLEFGLRLNHAGNDARLYLRTSNSGSRLRVVGEGFGQSSVDVNTGISNSTTNFDELEVRWVIDVANNTYVAGYRETVGSGAWIEGVEGTFGYDASIFNELNRMRVYSDGDWTAGSSVSLDSITVELTTVPEPSSFALLAGLCGLTLVMARRRT